MTRRSQVAGKTRCFMVSHPSRSADSTMMRPDANHYHTYAAEISPIGRGSNRKLSDGQATSAPFPNAKSKRSWRQSSVHTNPSSIASIIYGDVLQPKPSVVDAG